MAFSKAHHFHVGVYHLSLICRAASHPARVLILRRLLEYESCTVKELRRGIPLSQNTVSQHLRVLLNMQLLECAEEMPTVRYRLTSDLPISRGLLVEILGVQDRLEVMKSPLGEIMRLTAKDKVVIEGI